MASVLMSNLSFHKSQSSKVTCMYFGGRADELKVEQFHLTQFPLLIVVMSHIIIMLLL